MGSKSQDREGEGTMKPRKVKNWCSHITWNRVQDAWIIRYSLSVRYWVSSDWRFCPICGKRRPK